MTDIGYEAIYTILDEKAARELASCLSGHRVLFPRTIIEKDNIVRDFKDMIGSGRTKRDSVVALSQKYSLSIGEIYRKIRT